ncbi:MAG: serine/threonine protein kinase [Planctomycetaceae bacterium]
MSVSQPASESRAEPSAETLLQDAAEREASIRLSAPRQAPPAEVPGYDVGLCLGSGAYGSVWLATERNTGKQVAIKFYSHRRGLDWSLLNREVEKLALLYTSREVVGLLEVGWDADPPYYVMEFLQNGSLAGLLHAGPLPANQAVKIAAAVTQALVQAHAQGVLHCDVKPANVLLDGDFSPRLADFGQSRLSHEQTPALGTLFYMAPEQADLEATPDPRWDVYALGALLYHMLCGEPPFRTPDNERLIRDAGTLEEKLAAYRQIVERGPRPAKHRTVRGVDARLAEIVDRCLMADAARRFPNAAAVAQAFAERDRHRSLRPMIWLGIILPGLLLLALFPLAALAVSRARETAEENIAGRALESDAVSAKILAYSLADDLAQRTRTLTLIADDHELAPLLAGLSQPPDSEPRQALQAWLDHEKGEIDEVRRKSQNDLDESWFLTDTQGFQRWRNPHSPNSFEDNFSWRDYFHGQGADRPEWRGRTDVAPLTEPRISAPYRSSTTGNLKIAISVPVRDGEQRLVGILSRTIQLGALLGSYKRLLGEDQRDASGQRVIALVDIRDATGRLLDHPWLTADEIRNLSDETFQRLSVDQALYGQLAELRQRAREGQTREAQHLEQMYFDPIRHAGAGAARAYGQPWLAVFVPVGDTGLFAIVQERRDAALAPVQEIRDGLLKFGAGGLVLCVTLVLTSWYFARRVMRNGVSGDSRRASGPGGGPISGSLSRA